MNRTVPAACALAFIALLVLAFSPAQPETPAVPPHAWLEGSWSGDGFGGTSEEIWSAPSADGTMMGVYRHHNADGTLNFYEFLVLDSLGMHLKHFHPNLAGWEEKEDYHTFEMIRSDEKEIVMKGLRIQYLPPDSMRLYLSMRQKDGTRYTELFNMKRRTRPEQ